MDSAKSSAYDSDRLKGKKLLIFDMDGTLFDTSESNYWAYHDAAAELGYEIEHVKFLNVFVGKNYKEFLPQFGIEDDAVHKKIHDIKKAKYKHYFDKIRKNEELFKLMSNVKGKCKIALATTASKKNTYEILDFFRVNDFFDFILTQDDVNNLKPNPECYNKVMEIMKVSPKDTVIFEDSEVGIKAATLSGASVIKVAAF